MRVVKLHNDEVDIDEVLVRRLLGAQMPQWAALPLHLVDPAGTDNVMIRLGGTLVVRLPRTASAAAGVDKEQRLVPRLAPLLPVAVPAPAGFGVPDAGYPWHWSVSPWLAGLPATPGAADGRLAVQLAEFVTALRTIDTFGWPPRARCTPTGPTPWRDATRTPATASSSVATCSTSVR